MKQLVFKRHLEVHRFFRCCLKQLKVDAERFSHTSHCLRTLGLCFKLRNALFEALSIARARLSNLCRCLGDAQSLAESNQTGREKRFKTSISSRTFLLL